MNNLKFRAKANINDEWVYASNIHKVILDGTNEKLWVMHPKGEKIEHLGDGYIKYRPLVVDEETIGQYTGLKDKNGKEIYLGDMVKVTKKHFENEGDREYEYVGDVRVNEAWLQIKNKHLTSYVLHTMCIEVIGNIHENKELLETH